jgi:hypothetical protein
MSVFCTWNLLLTKTAKLKKIDRIDHLRLYSENASGWHECFTIPYKKSLRSWREHWMKKKGKDRSKQLKALTKESERNLIEQICRQLALPMNRRTHFLRKRLPGGGSCLQPSSEPYEKH